MDIEKIGLIAQEIAFAFEDDFNDLGKRKMFENLFNEYLVVVDESGIQSHYDSIVKLGRSHPELFDAMVVKMRESSLITG